MKLLVLTAEPISADVLREAAGDGTDDAEVMVVSPALTDSPLRFWVSDADAAIEHAESTAEETVERLDEEGVDAVGDTGESDPMQALEDALATFDADSRRGLHAPGGRAGLPRGGVRGGGGGAGSACR